MGGIRISQKEIKEINELYLQLGSYASVARKLSISPSTVKKYIIKDYVSEERLQEKISKKKFTKKDLPPFNVKKAYMFLDEGKDFSPILNLSLEEKKEIQELWKEMVI